MLLLSIILSSHVFQCPLFWFCSVRVSAPPFFLLGKTLDLTSTRIKKKLTPVCQLKDSCFTFLEGYKIWPEKGQKIQSHAELFSTQPRGNSKKKNLMFGQTWGNEVDIIHFIHWLKHCYKIKSKKNNPNEFSVKEMFDSHNLNTLGIFKDFGNI